MKIRKNDNVMVITGNDRGKTGKVLKVFPSESKVIIEGINLRKRHTKPNRNSPRVVLLKKKPRFMFLMLCFLILNQMNLQGWVHRLFLMKKPARRKVSV
jgi:large subunit ribosomal protein L24